ncbi:hypothetical protein [Arenimonas sp.]|uniref:hypothetical protein n=1 Tax=Arenimonas sp. TaxID=1872635 RepID=UPI0025BD7410|nr:hypothetical protein [Arenimonas sp.]
MPLPRSLLAFLALVALAFVAILGWLAWHGLWSTAAMVAAPVGGGLLVWAAALRRRAGRMP